MKVQVGNAEFKVGGGNLTPAQSGKAPVGQQTGLRLFSFLRELFVSNETNKLTDDQLREILVAEFDHDEKTLASIRGGKSKRNRIAVWRSLYNTGASFGHPVVVSFQYDGRGRPISGANGRPLTTEEQRQICLHYEIPDTRFQTKEECARIRAHQAKIRPALVQHVKKSSRVKDVLGRPNVRNPKVRPKSNVKSRRPPG